MAGEGWGPDFLFRYMRFPRDVWAMGRLPGEENHGVRVFKVWTLSQRMSNVETQKKKLQALITMMVQSDSDRRSCWSTAR